MLWCPIRLLPPRNKKNIIHCIHHALPKARSSATVNPEMAARRDDLRDTLWELREEYRNMPEEDALMYDPLGLMQV
ncbi:hypothetical protein CYMTET_55484 [Cymbomonas tetramitiformis]|uniref:Uncharacterized protein n=1 Tax=Cymbomonas tetramitiformis TaxID=36881 RepID=A0AAE0EPQ2_9CHLO|nr:hypothetical protein CYMTET_55484 [Cymbomonas tetramitiformis]